MDMCYFVVQSSYVASREKGFDRGVLPLKIFTRGSLESSYQHQQWLPKQVLVCLAFIHFYVFTDIRLFYRPNLLFVMLGYVRYNLIVVRVEK